MAFSWVRFLVLWGAFSCLQHRAGCNEHCYELGGLEVLEVKAYRGDVFDASSAFGRGGSTVLPHTSSNIGSRNLDMASPHPAPCKHMQKHQTFFPRLWDSVQKFVFSAPTSPRPYSQGLASRGPCLTPNTAEPVIGNRRRGRGGGEGEERGEEIHNPR